jgi:hypothetical protein
MDYFAVEAYALSCLLPLLAFLLLALQFYQASTSKTQNGSTISLIEEFPSRLSDLVSITSERSQSPVDTYDKYKTGEPSAKTIEEGGKSVEKRERGM